MKTEGRCFCGEVRFSVEVDPTKVALCHCTDCQQVSGSAFLYIALVLRESLVFHSGTITSFDKVGDSGNVRCQKFCVTCGTNIGSTPPEDDASPFASIRVPLLEAREDLPPRVQMWHRSHVEWLDGIDGIPALDTQG